MKITRRQLRRIISEELSLLNEQRSSASRQAAAGSDDAFASMGAAISGQPQNREGYLGELDAAVAALNLASVPKTAGMSRDQLQEHLGKYLAAVETLPETQLPSAPGSTPAGREFLKHKQELSVRKTEVGLAYGIARHDSQTGTWYFTDHEQGLKQ